MFFATIFFVVVFYNVLLSYRSLEKTLDARLPAALKVLLTEVDGGVYFMEKKQLSCRMIADLLPKLEDLNPKLWPRERFIPFCGNEEALLAIDLKTDAVVEWDSDDGTIRIDHQKFVLN